MLLREPVIRGEGLVAFAACIFLPTVLIVNQVNVIQPQHPLPKLPVARAIWAPEPNLKVAATAWIHAGGGHHTALSFALRPKHLENFADMAGMECLLIDAETTIAGFRKELRWNDMYYHLANGF